MKSAKVYKVHQYIQMREYSNDLCSNSHFIYICGLHHAVFADNSSSINSFYFKVSWTAEKSRSPNPKLLAFLNAYKQSSNFITSWNLLDRVSEHLKKHYLIVTYFGKEMWLWGVNCSHLTMNATNLNLNTWIFKVIMTHETIK